MTTVLTIFGGIAVAVQLLMAFARTRPKDAKQALGEWAESFHLSRLALWLNEHRADQWVLRHGPTLRSVALVAVALVTAALVYQTVQLRVDLDRERAERSNRTIRPEQAALIVQLLAPSNIFKGKVIVNPTFDGEPWQFGEQILRVLKDAGFPADEAPFGDRSFGYSRPGTFIWIKDANNRPKHAGPILVAFKHAGITLLPEFHSDLADSDTVIIAVSSHP